MYLINYDCYDLHALITFFRCKPERFIIYKSALQEIVAYLKTPIQNELNNNSIRNILKPYFDERDETISWVLVDNEYTANVFIIKNESAYEILSSIFCEMMNYYNDSNRFYLLCDATHNIPLLLADEKKPKKAINTMIKDYKKKYNNLFLKNELKRL